MTDTPLVTINIPTYNQSRYIRRAVESALAQTYSNLEVIVADDQSTDDTYAVASSIRDSRLRVVRNDRNLGRVGNYRHMLYELARGEWVVNLDGGDWYDDPAFIARAIGQVLSDPSNVMYAAGSRSFIEATGRYVSTPMGLSQDRATLSGVEYVLGYPELGATQHFAVLYNREKALRVGFYQLDSLGTDTDSICRLALTGKVVVERRYVGVWTEHAQNASYTLSPDTLKSEVEMLRRVANALAKHVPEEIWTEWLETRVFWKTQFTDKLALARLPYARAWSLLTTRARFDRFTFRETVKLLVRPVRNIYR